MKHNGPPLTPEQHRFYESVFKAPAPEPRRSFATFLFGTPGMFGYWSARQAIVRYGGLLGFAILGVTMDFYRPWYGPALSVGCLAWVAFTFVLHYRNYKGLQA